MLIQNRALFNRWQSIQQRSIQINTQNACKSINFSTPNMFAIQSIWKRAYKLVISSYQQKVKRKLEENVLTWGVRSEQSDNALLRLRTEEEETDELSTDPLMKMIMISEEELWRIEGWVEILRDRERAGLIWESWIEFWLERGPRKENREG